MQYDILMPQSSQQLAWIIFPSCAAASPGNLHPGYYKSLTWFKGRWPWVCVFYQSWVLIAQRLTGDSQRKNEQQQQSVISGYLILSICACHCCIFPRLINLRQNYLTKRKGEFTMLYFSLYNRIIALLRINERNIDYIGWLYLFILIILILAWLVL